MSLNDPIRTAVAFIETHLTEEIGFVDVARAVAFSPYHFHRLFSGAVGESITEYIRKRRLAEAAGQLTRTRHRIIDIALTYRFESQASFTKAFRRVYGTTPGAYRRRGAHLTMSETMGRTESQTRTIRQEPRIVQLPERLIVGLQYVGTNKNGEIPQMWGVANARFGEIPNCIGTDHLAIGYCETLANPKEECEFSYIAGMFVSEVGELPSGMVSRKVPAGTYAVFTHEGTLADLGKSYEHIYGTWLPGAPYEALGTHDYELYDERFNPTVPEVVLELHLPVRPKA